MKFNGLPYLKMMTLLSGLNCLLGEVKADPTE
ncbi:MAG: hypothetical protein ACI898_001015 [Flavobacteriales bacterium]|jgi:hypothetical protein